MPIIVLSTCFAIHSSAQKTTLENICFIPYIKTVFVKLITTISLSFTLLILPIIVMLFNIQKTDFLYVFLGICEIIIRWSALIIGTQIIGFLLGKLFKSYISYVFTVPLAVLFTYVNEPLFALVQGLNQDQFLQNIFLFNRMFPFSGISNFSGPIISIFTVSKSIMIISFFAMLLSFYFVCIKAKKAIIFTVLFAVLFVIFLMSYSHFYPKSYSYDITEENINIEKFNNISPNSFEISSYKGKINLKEFLDADIHLYINKKSVADVLPLKLDNSLHVLSLKSNGRDISYTRDSDYLYIIDQNLLDQDSFPVEITYKGRISYGDNNIYTTNFASSLPSVFAFVPLVVGDNSIHSFDIDVTAKNTVVSNIDLIIKDNNTYSIIGKSDSFMIYSGFIDSYKNNNQTVFYGKYINRESILLGKTALDYKVLKIIDIVVPSYDKVFALSNNLYGQNHTIDYGNYLLVGTEGW